MKTAKSVLRIISIATINECLKASSLILALSGLLLVSGCGSPVGQPSKYPIKEDVLKHVLGIYKQVYDDSIEQETENAKNDISSFSRSSFSSFPLVIFGHIPAELFLSVFEHAYRGGGEVHI